MKRACELLILLLVGTLAACGGESSSSAAANGTISLAITDGPMDEAAQLVLHVTHMNVANMDGIVTRLELLNGAQDIDMMQLQNGVSHDLLAATPIPAGQYQWMELGVDLTMSHIGTMSGGNHTMTLADPHPFRAMETFQIAAGLHADFVMDFDLHSAVRQHDMGGMMGVEYQLHDGMHLMNSADVGGLMGTVDVSLMDINQAACDPAAGGNWVYLFDGAVAQPDDLAINETDGFPGPIASDLVELNPGSGEYRYHFGFILAGNYRVAFTCSGEWDEEGDDDYPTDPDGKFDFHGMSAPVDVVAGQMMVMDITP